MLEHPNRRRQRQQTNKQKAKKEREENERKKNAQTKRDEKSGIFLQIRSSSFSVIIVCRCVEITERCLPKEVKQKTFNLYLTFNFSLRERELTDRTSEKDEVRSCRSSRRWGPKKMHRNEREWGITFKITHMYNV